HFCSYLAHRDLHSFPTRRSSDLLIQIAHNVDIGQHTVIAAQTGISGSTKIGEHNVIAGQVGIVGHIKLANRTKIGAQAGVSKTRSEEHTSELQSRENLVCRLLLE